MRTNVSAPLPVMSNRLRSTGPGWPDAGRGSGSAVSTRPTRATLNSTLVSIMMPSAPASAVTSTIFLIASRSVRLAVVRPKSACGNGSLTLTRVVSA